MNLLFDLDGTLTDPKPGIVGCIEHALKQLNRNPADFPNLEQYIGPPLLASFEAMLGSETEARSAVQFYRERFGAVGLYENSVYDGINESLSNLSAAGHKMVVATSKPRVYAVKIVEHFDLGGFFDFVYGSELDGRRSDKSELISFILNREAFDKSQTLMIGDRLHDALGAQANGVRSLGVLWGYGSYEELSGAGVDSLCEAPSELIKCVA